MNVEPYADNRVKLQVREGENDYINASPIRLGDRKYIATQGPKETTVNHFWRMIAELELEVPVVVVMLTQTHEAGKETCFQYFPLTPDESPMSIPPVVGDSNRFQGQVALRNAWRLDTTRSDLRTMTLESRLSPSEPLQHSDIWHLSFSNWPDFLIPEGEDRAALVMSIQVSCELSWRYIPRDADEERIIASLDELDPSFAASSRPRIIHCSAGIGRTGTFIALDYLLSLLHNGKFDDISQDQDPVLETVDLLRQQRMMMVQGEPQFNFIYEVLRDEWQRRAALADDAAPIEAASRPISTKGAKVVLAPGHSPTDWQH
jgi:protein-tyrosine phosphatase